MFKAHFTETQPRIVVFGTPMKGWDVSNYQTSPFTYTLEFPCCSWGIPQYHITPQTSLQVTFSFESQTSLQTADQSFTFPLTHIPIEIQSQGSLRLHHIELDFHPKGILSPPTSRILFS